MSVRKEQLDAFVKKSPSVFVETIKVLGSTPRENGAWMLVSEDHLLGTIGGGQLEYIAIDNARQMLRSRETLREIDVPLGPEIGQCCGGRVCISFAAVSSKVATDLKRRLVREIERRVCVYIMGAGHVGRALANALAALPLRTIVVDTRKEALHNLPNEVETRLSALPEAEVRRAPKNSVFVVLTHDHALDFIIAREALARDDASYVGMIGSKTKRAAFLNWLKKEGVQADQVAKLICPIGGGQMADKRPEVIGALVAAEILVHTGNRTNNDSNKIEQFSEFLGGN